MGIFDIMLHVRRLMMFGLAVLIGFPFSIHGNTYTDFCSAA